VLSNPIHQRLPYPYFTTEEAFSATDCARLEGLFAQDLPWREHGGSFYEVRNCDLTDRVDTALREALTHRVRALTELALDTRVAVTAQAMGPGQQIGVHSDRPLVGYEAVRLVVQCTHDWHPGDGGILQVHDDAGGTRICASLTPRFNSAFGFIMHPDSYHSVTRTRRSRHTLVFNFWHVGNSPALADQVKGLFSDMQFAKLPRALDPICLEAEASLPEDQTYRALVVASALRLLGLPEQTILAGYLAVVRPCLAQSTSAEAGLAIALAQWAARLHLDGFDVARWQELAPMAAQSADLPRLEAFRKLAFPATANG
jgi:hypothetical protein